MPVPVRVVVVGGGVIGLLTAMECVRAGAQVELVDQAGIPSRLATSYDRHRVVRALHRGDPVLTRAAVRAHAGWLEVERRLGTRCYHQVGALTAMPVGRVPAELGMLTQAGVSARPLRAAELPGAFPRLRFPAGLGAVFEPAAGAVLADRLLAALAGWLRGAPGVRLHPGRRVAGLGEPGRVGGGGPGRAGGWGPGGAGGGCVRFDDGSELTGDRVVVAAGPWSRDLLPAALSADLTLYRQTMLSYAPTPSRDAWTGTPAIPAFGTAGGAWLMPPVADTPVRLSASNACRAVPELTDRAAPKQWRDRIAAQFRELLVDFDPAAIVDASDGYYLAGRAGGGPLLASLDGGAVWAYAACGGMSFKFAPLVARALADRALGRPPHRTGLDPVDRPRALANPAGGRVR